MQGTKLLFYSLHVNNAPLACTNVLASSLVLLHVHTVQECQAAASSVCLLLVVSVDKGL